MLIDAIRWAGIAACLSQCALFSGLNLALFSISRLRLESAAGEGDRAVLNVHYFLRAVLFGRDGVDPGVFCHHPLVVRDAHTPLGQVLNRLTVHPENAADDVIDRDIILVWSAQRRIITGSDLLGRLLRGIARRAPQ